MRTTAPWPPAYVKGLSCFGGVHTFDFYLSVFQKGGGNRLCESLFALLTKAVILPHHKAASPVGAVKVFLALVNRRAATGASADCFPLRGKQLRFILGNRGIGLDKPRCHFLNAAHEIVRAVAAFGNPGKAGFPFCRKLRGRKDFGQDSGKVIPVLCGD